MMSIGKLAAGTGAGGYHIDQVAQGREDYYAGEGDAAGMWIGLGAASLGLSGQVREQGLARLLDGCDPASGLLLRPARSSYYKHGRIVAASSADAARERLVGDWLEAHERGERPS